MSHRIKIIETDAGTWYAVIATHNDTEVCRCNGISKAEYMCQLLQEHAKKLSGEFWQS